jgi:hypothetical protein
MNLTNAPPMGCQSMEYPCFLGQQRHFVLSHSFWERVFVVRSMLSSPPSPRAADPMGSSVGNPFYSFLFLLLSLSSFAW